MTIPELQALISRLRTEIDKEHNEVVYQKFLMNNYDNLHYVDCKDSFRNTIQKSSAKIAKLASLQRSLKKDLAEMIRSERVLRSFDKWRGSNE